MMKLIVSVFVAILVANTNSFPSPSKEQIAKFKMLDDMRFAAHYNPKAGLIPQRYRWPGGVVVYQLDSAFSASERAVIEQGFQDIRAKTCITFRQRTSESDYVYVIRGGHDSGCWSYVGRIGGRQDLNLQYTGTGGGHCLWPHVVSHEFLHAIGFMHEQSRTDRDDWVDINWGNIYPEYHYAFDKLPASEISPFDTPYDYRSVMHYEAYAFAINPSIPTIYPRQTGASLGNNELSALDAQGVNNMYRGHC